MKKLNKKSNIKKENLETYEMYSCACSCRSYCGQGNITQYYAFKDLQASDHM